MHQLIWYFDTQKETNLTCETLPKERNEGSILLGSLEIRSKKRRQNEYLPLQATPGRWDDGDVWGIFPI